MPRKTRTTLSFMHWEEKEPREELGKEGSSKFDSVYGCIILPTFRKAGKS